MDGTLILAINAIVLTFIVIAQVLKIPIISRRVKEVPAIKSFWGKVEGPEAFVRTVKRERTNPASSTAPKYKETLYEQKHSVNLRELGDMYMESQAMGLTMVITFEDQPKRKITTGSGE